MEGSGFRIDLVQAETTKRKGRDKISDVGKETLMSKGLQAAQYISNPVRKRLYTVREAAYFLGRSEYSVRVLIWGKKIPVLKNEGRGSKIWLDINDLNNFIQNSKGFVD